MDLEKMLVLLIVLLLPLPGCLGNEPEPEPAPDFVTIVSSDSIDSVTDGGSDNLIDVELISDHEFDWVDIKVKLEIGSMGPLNCYQNDQSADCTFGDGDGDSVWEQNEIITVSEGQTSLCNSGGCEIEIEIGLENDTGFVHILRTSTLQIS